MVNAPTRMAREAAEAPQRVAAQLAANAAAVQAAGRHLRALAPPFVATLARGSSDQAAGFAKHLLEVHCATPVLSHAPSTGSLYHATSPRFAGAAVLAISQSGRSPDLLAAAAEAQDRGALLIALVNDTGSPLAALADIVLPVAAGPETSVAATKSFVGTLAALLHLAAEWSDDPALHAALARAPAALAGAAAADWHAAVPLMAPHNRLLVLGRGPTLPIAGEAALKLKETCAIQAEAFSSAEVAHGPMTLVSAGDPVLAFLPGDAAGPGMAERLADFAARGARVIAAGPGGTLAVESGLHPALSAIAQIQAFYPLADALAAARGLDPDHPPHLSKVTRTL